jgi:DNA-directed RNA polymerase subunit F
MIGKEANEKGYASISDVYDILKTRKSGELKYEQQIVLEYTEKFKADKRSYNRISSVMEGIDELSESMRAKILEVLPKSEILLKQVLAGEKIMLSDEHFNALLKAINEGV